MTWVKTLLSHLEDGVIDDATLGYTSERIAKIRVSNEGQEGLNAFFDKRKPNWSSAQIDSKNISAQGAK